MNPGLLRAYRLPFKPLSLRFWALFKPLQLPLQLYPPAPSPLFLCLPPDQTDF